MRSKRLVFTIVGTALVWAASVVAASGPSSASPDIQLQLGDLLFAEGRYGEAADAYERAKRVLEQARERESSRFRRALGGLVRSLLRIAEFSRAKTEAMELRQAAPQDAEVVALYGDALWAAGLFDEAERAYRDALALDPAAPRGHHGLAKALAARSRLDEAMLEAQAALKLAPREAEYHHSVGTIFERQHRFEEAAIAFGNYVNLIPNRDRSDKAVWARATIRFLRAFGGRTPFAIEGDGVEMLHTVPFRLVRDKVVVRGTINDGKPIDFVLDTGAEQTVLSRRTAEQHGVQPITYTLSAGVGEMGLRGLQIGRIDVLQIGSLRIRNVPCLIKNPPLGGLPTREGESFSPLTLGLSMTIDYARRELTFGRRLPQRPYDVDLPLWLYRLAVVRGTINEALPASFVVDTGGEVISLSLATASAVKPAVVTRRIPLKVYGSSGWDRDAYLMPGINLAFASIRFDNFPVVVLNLRAPSALLGFQLGGIVGHKFLSQYRVAIDLERSLLRLARS